MVGKCNRDSGADITVVTDWKVGPRSGAWERLWASILNDLKQSQGLGTSDEDRDGRGNQDVCNDPVND